MEKGYPADYLARKELAPGIKVHVLSSGERLTQCWVAMAAGTRLPVHSHRHEQASYIVSGRVRWEIDGLESEGAPASSLIFAPHQPHGCLVLEDCVIVDTFTPVREEYLAGE